MSAEDAITVVQNSEWGKARRAAGAKPVSIADVVNDLITVDPSKTARNRKFRVWCSLALKAFEERHPEAIRKTDAGTEYEEKALKAYLHDLYMGEIKKEFGDPF